MSRARDLADYVSTGVTSDELNLLDGSDTGSLSHRNMVINGAAQVAQRATTTAPTPKGASDDGYYCWDRWRLLSENSTAARFNLIQATVTDLAGFPHAMHIDCTTANTSLSGGDADDAVSIWQRFEGQDFQRPGIGTSGAQPMTASFYMKGTAGKTIMFELYDRVNNKICQQQITVTSAWTRHSVSIPAITSGSVITNDNARRVDMGFWLHAGNNYTSGTYNANTWKSIVPADRAVGVGSGIMSTTSDELFITGVQLELGSVATPFEHRSYGDEFQRCLRYYERWQRANADTDTEIVSVGVGYWYSTQQLLGHLKYAEKRGLPTITISSADWAHVYDYQGSTNTNDTTSPFDSVTRKGARLKPVTVDATNTNGGGSHIILNSNYSEYIEITAEL